MSGDESTFSYAYIVGLGPDCYECRIGVDARPDLNLVDSFAVVLYFVRGDERFVEVARIDDSEHDGDGWDGSPIDIHHWYRDVRLHERDYDIDVTTWWEADAYLEANFEHFARRYLENHGDRIVADDRAEK